ncbi:MAG: TonB-dependent receptor [Pseudomonadota bacterium]
MNFTTSLAPKICSRLLLSSAALPMFLASSAFAQTTPAAPPAGETVVVTGSLIARPDYNTATPTVSVTPKDLQTSGQIALEQGLVQMPQFSVNTTGAGPFIGGSGEVNLDLRYLGPQRNLVLLDGRRLLPSSADGTVDLNQLPQGIVGGVDIITGGASAVYGSDAVSGVVNLKTKKPFNGLDVTTSYGTTEQYGGSQFDVNGVGGFETDDGKGSLMFAVEYTQRGKVNSASIPFLVQYGNYPVPMASGEFTPGSNQPSQAAINSYFAQFGAPAGNVSRSELLGFNNDGSLYNVGKNPVAPFNVYNLIPQTDPQGRPLENVLAGSVHHKSYAQWSQLPLTRWSAFTKGDWTIFPGVHAYIQGLYTDYTSKINVEPTVTSGLQIPTVPTTNPFIPAALASLLATRPNPGAPFSLSDRFYSFGYRTITNQNHIYQFVGGLDGTFGDTMTWELYGSHGQTTTDYASTGAVRFSVIQQLLNAPDGGNSLCAGGYNPFGVHPVSQACENLAAPVITQSTVVNQDVINADLQGTAFTLPAGDLKFALGADYRNIAYSYLPDAEIQSGDPFTYNTQTPTKGSSPVKEVFGELLIPVVKDVPFFENVTADIAARYSDYDLSGGSPTYKGDIDWAVTDGFRLRGGYERAIRAPAVSELFSGQSTQYQNLATITGTLSDPCDVTLPYVNGANGAQIKALCAAQGMPASLASTYTNNNPQTPVVQSGNTALRPERADTFTGGMVYQPQFDTPWFQNASISVDYYNVRLKNAIAAIPISLVVSSCFNLNGQNPSYSAANANCALLNRSPATGFLANSLAPYENLGQIKTGGVDLEADWLTDFDGAMGWSDAGTLGVNLVGTYLNDFKLQAAPGGNFTEYGGTNYTGLYGPYATWRFNSTFTYHNWGADIGLRWRFIGAMQDSSVATSATRTPGAPGQPPLNYFDLTMGYTLTDTQTRLSLTVSNLLDTTPPTVGAFPGNTIQGLYSPLGRLYLLTLGQRF